MKLGGYDYEFRYYGVGSNDRYKIHYSKEDISDCTSIYLSCK